MAKRWYYKDENGNKVPVPQYKINADDYYTKSMSDSRYYEKSATDTLLADKVSKSDSIYNSLEAAQKYASENVKAYPGQIISVVTGSEVKVYKINNGNLEELGKCSLVTDQNPNLLATADNIGQIIYLTTQVIDGKDTYSPGPYIVSGDGTVSKIGTTSVSGDIAGDVATLQGKVSTLESTVGKKVDKTDITQSTGTSETAVMSQKAVSDIVDELEQTIDNIKKCQIDITKVGYIRLIEQDGNPAGSFASSNGYRCSDFISVEYANKLVYTCKAYAQTVATVAFYREDKSFISGIRSTDSKTEIMYQDFPLDTKFIRVTHDLSQGDSYSAYMSVELNNGFSLKLNEDVKSNKAVLENHEEQITDINSEVFSFKEPSVPFTNGLLIWYETTSEHIGGTTAQSLSYAATDFIEVTNVISIETNSLDFSGNAACIAFYDSAKKYISGIRNTSNKKVISAKEFPENTNYIRLCTNITAQQNPYVSIFKGVKSEVENLQKTTQEINRYNSVKKEEIELPFSLGCYISSGVNQGQPSGELITGAGDGYAATKDFYLLDNAESIVFKCASWGRTIFNIAFYDENKVYIENSGSIYSSAEETVIESKDFPVGAKYARFSHQVAVSSSYYAKYNNSYSIIEVINDITEGADIKGAWAVCGDSITHANHNGIEDVDVNDNFCPFDNVHGIPSGTASIYRRKNYAYYVAKEMKLKWANYGWGGTTMHNCTYNGIFLNGFSVDRYKQFADGVDFNYISIFFGYNDTVFGVYAQKEKWLSETYGGTIYYPTKIEDIGKVGFATQEQKDAVDAVTGVVNGVNYDNSRDYFIAKMVGTIDDADNTTFMGAFNVVLPYLINKYPLSKILLIVPYAITYDNVHESGPNKMMRDSVIAIARKWNVAYYDFRESCPFLEKSDAPMTGYADLRDFRERTLTADRLHPNNDGYKYMYPSILNKLKSL